MQTGLIRRVLLLWQGRRHPSANAALVHAVNGVATIVADGTGGNQEALPPAAAKAALRIARSARSAATASGDRGVTVAPAAALSQASAADSADGIAPAAPLTGAGNTSSTQGVPPSVPPSSASRPQVVCGSLHWSCHAVMSLPLLGPGEKETPAAAASSALATSVVVVSEAMGVASLSPCRDG